MKSKGGLGIFYSPFVCHIVCMCFGIEWFSSERDELGVVLVIVCDEYTVW